MKNKKGFTLIELLVVMGILALLATAVIIIIRPAEHFREAREVTRTSHINTIMNTVFTYLTTNQAWPSCVRNSIGEVNAVDVINCNIVVDPNLLPRDPQTGSDILTGYEIFGNLHPDPGNNEIVSVTIRSKAAESNASRTQ